MDGMQILGFAADLAIHLTTPVIASGGVSSMEGLEEMVRSERREIVSVRSVRVMQRFRLLPLCLRMP